MLSAADTDRIFSALADQTRRDILRRALAGSEGVSELAAHYPISFAAVQKHVAVLERAGLVSKKRAGRRLLVMTRPETIGKAAALLGRYEEMWRARSDRMSAVLDEQEQER